MNNNIRSLLFEAQDLLERAKFPQDDTGAIEAKCEDVIERIAAALKEIRA